MEFHVAVYRIWGSHSGGCEEFCLLGYNAVVVRWQSTDVPQEDFALIIGVKEYANHGSTKKNSGSDECQFVHATVFSSLNVVNKFHLLLLLLTLLYVPFLETILFVKYSEGISRSSQGLRLLWGFPDHYDTTTEVREWVISENERRTWTSVHFWQSKRRHIPDDVIP